MEKENKFYAKKTNNVIKPTSIRLNIELLEKIEQDAFINKRSISKQIEYIVENFYKQKEVYK